MEKQNKKQNQTESVKRLPYEPPAVLSEEVFETLALSCASVGPFQCPTGAANS